MSDPNADLQAVQESVHVALVQYHAKERALGIDPAAPAVPPVGPSQVALGWSAHKLHFSLWEIEGQIHRRHRAKMQALGLDPAGDLPANHPGLEQARRALEEYQLEYAEVEAVPEKLRLMFGSPPEPQAGTP